MVSTSKTGGSNRKKALDSCISRKVCVSRGGIFTIPDVYQLVFSSQLKELFNAGDTE